MSDVYILNTNENARNRLGLQHELYVKSSTQLLDEAGIKPGMKGLEIGCGSGAMTIELARMVGDTGRILSIDLSSEQIEATKAFTQNYHNIDFKVWDVNHLSDLNEQFDFIYCRMVLHHLVNAQDAVLQMKKCLKPNGLVICEEPSIFDSTFCAPESAAYEQFTQLARGCFLSNQRDIGIAHRLELDFSACGFTVLHHSLFQPLLRREKEKEIYAMALDDLTPQLLEQHLATTEQIAELSAELKSLARTNSTLSWIRMHRVIAQV